MNDRAGVLSQIAHFQTLPYYLQSTDTRTNPITDEKVRLRGLKGGVGPAVRTASPVHTSPRGPSTSILHLSPFFVITVTPIQLVS